MAYKALFSDGYCRFIAGPHNTQEKAEAYALSLEAWFVAGGRTDRKLIEVTTADQAIKRWEAVEV